VQGVCRLGEVWDFTNSRGRLRDWCCKRSRESKTQITKGYLKIAARSACKDPFGGLEFVRERSEGIEPMKCSKGGGSQNPLTKVKFRREDANSFGQKSLRS
jgi:hypothetical protein